MRCISIVRSLYFKIFSASFLITFLSPEIATTTTTKTTTTTTSSSSSSYLQCQRHHHHHHKHHLTSSSHISKKPKIHPTIDKTDNFDRFLTRRKIFKPVFSGFLCSKYVDVYHMYDFMASGTKQLKKHW
jgi:hypothetical protein